jgi:hypothetical protein
MAERRMFAKSIIDSDAFLDMPLSAQALYFHLSMRADDEGFISNPKKIMRMIGASNNEIEILLAKRYLLSFDSGIVVIKHWRIHNYIQKDRFKSTLYKEERQTLNLKENNIYTDSMDTECIQDGDAGKVRLELGKSKSKDNINMPDSRNFAKEWETCLNLWNSLDLPKYKVLLCNEREAGQIKNWMVSYNLSEIEGSIINYSDFIGQIDQQYRYRTYRAFIEKGLPQFFDRKALEDRYGSNESVITQEEADRLMGVEDV